MNVLRSTRSCPIRSRWAAHAALAVAILLGTLASGAALARAALLRLRTECQSSQAVVTLGDLAEISAADPRQADALAAIELFPTPLAPQQRFVRLREIQDLLLLRGVNLAEHQFSGSSRVAVRAASKPVEKKPKQPVRPERPLSFSASQTATRRVIDSVVHYLQGHVSADESWIVQAELAPDLARLVAAPGRPISIIGGAPPWTGDQRFQLTVNTSDGPVRFPLDAQVTTSPALVVAARPLLRGALIGAADVELRSATPRQRGSGGFHSIDEVVGKETTCAVSEGKVLQQKSVRSPLLVRRGEVVTVYARSAGICVRTVARARDNGSLGELVSLESLLDRTSFFAQVSNVREVEIFARSPKADRAKAGRLPPPAGRQPRAATRSTYRNTRPPSRPRENGPTRNGGVANASLDLTSNRDPAK